MKEPRPATLFSGVGFCSFEPHTVLHLEEDWMLTLEQEAVLEKLRTLWTLHGSLRFLQLVLSTCPYDVDLAQVPDEEFIGFMERFLPHVEIARA